MGEAADVGGGSRRRWSPWWIVVAVGGLYTALQGPPTWDIDQIEVEAVDLSFGGASATLLVNATILYGMPFPGCIAPAAHDISSPDGRGATRYLGVASTIGAIVLTPGKNSVSFRFRTVPVSPALALALENGKRRLQSVAGLMEPRQKRGWGKRRRQQSPLPPPLEGPPPSTTVVLREEGLAEITVGIPLPSFLFSFFPSWKASSSSSGYTCLPLTLPLRVSARCDQYIRTHVDPMNPRVMPAYFDGAKCTHTPLGIGLFGGLSIPFFGLAPPVQHNFGSFAPLSPFVGDD